MKKKWKEIKNEFGQKFFNFMMNPLVNYGIIMYLIIIGIIIILTAENNISIYLGIFDILLGVISFIWYRKNTKDIEKSRALLNYIDIYKNMPSYALLKYQKMDYESIKKYILNTYECLLDPHEVITYITTHPGTPISEYLSKEIEKLDRNFFKNGFLIIDLDAIDKIALFKYNKKLEKG